MIQVKVKMHILLKKYLLIKIQIQNKLYIDIYDEIRERIPDEEQHNIYKQKRENRYLGYITIPFSNIYTNSEIEGVFEIVSPEFVNAYKYLDIGDPEEQEISQRDDIKQKQDKYSNNERKRLREEEEMLRTAQIKDNLHIRISFF